MITIKVNHYGWDYKNKTYNYTYDRVIYEFINNANDVLNNKFESFYSLIFYSLIFYSLIFYSLIFYRIYQR